MKRFLCISLPVVTAVGLVLVSCGSDSGGSITTPETAPGLASGELVELSAREAGDDDSADNSGGNTIICYRLRIIS